VTSWTPIDCHAHTTMSDGELTVQELIDLVHARGVRPSVTDHLSTDVSYAVKSVDAVRAYLDELEPYDVAVGGEFCWHDPLWRELPDDITARFTHRIGSLHAVKITGAERPLSMFHRALPDALTPSQYMDYHLDDLERLAAEMPVDILAHPTLIPLPIRNLPTDELWTDEREERMVEALFNAGIAFEISNRYRPHERLVQRAHDRGVQLSLGSDGHTRAQVGDLAFPLEMAKRVGAEESSLFDPFVHGTRAAR
jgi:histidinol phosphatase-like PHP family hydrolase